MKKNIYVKGQGYIEYEGIIIKPCKFCNHIGIEFDTDCENDKGKLMHIVECGNDDCTCESIPRPYTEAETLVDAIVKWNNGEY